VIRDEVRRLPAGRAVVVVSNDAEIVADVKALGANIVPSNTVLALLSRAGAPALTGELHDPWRLAGAPRCRTGPDGQRRPVN